MRPALARQRQQAPEPITLSEINEATAIHVSAISGFEIAIKVAKGKPSLPKPPQDWFGQVVEHLGLAVLPLELSVGIAAAQLPPHHNDPYDRFIIATAKLRELPVVTSDERLEPYGVGAIWRSLATQLGLKAGARSGPSASPAPASSSGQAHITS
jgi:PIN domain nuclease of toxin-antitoxin system